jgi:FkbM family methyltransferase
LASAFFDCQFLFTANDLYGAEPYMIFEDEQSDPFLPALVAACRGKKGVAHRSIGALKARKAPVFMTAPVWHRHFEALIAAGVHGERARVLLYFDVDPSGYWDFAKGCGDALSDVMHKGELDDAALIALQPFLEEWVAGRPFAGRISSLIGFTNKDFSALVQRNGVAVARVFSHFADDVSRSVYARILFGGLEEIFAAFARQVFGEQQYMEIVDFRPGERIINCGVNRGWELPYFITKMRGEGVIYNFDPTISYENNAFRDFLIDCEPMMRNDRIVLGAYDGRLSLPSSDADMVRSGDGAASEGGAVAMISFPMRSIDSLAADGVFDGVDYIKMDVEGGEKNILQGALETIRKYRPKLAVAIYHEPEHFWEYPNFLIDQLDGYNFYLRQYGYSRFETLLYAVPKEREAARSGQEGLGRGLQARRRAEDGVVECYLYDLKARSFYLGPRRVLMRFEGASWQGGDLRSAPRIEADTMIGVWEAEDGRYFATRHLYADGQTRVGLGRSGENPQEIDWFWAFGCARDALVLPIWNVNSGFGFAVYEPGSQMGVAKVTLGLEPSLVWTTSVGYAGVPVLVSALGDDAGFEAYTLNDDRLSLYYYQFNNDGKRMGPEALYDIPAPLRGVVRLKRHIDGEIQYEPGFLVGEPGSGWAEILVVKSGELASAGSMDLDPGFQVVQPLFLGEVETAAKPAGRPRKRALKV